MDWTLIITAIIGVFGGAGFWNFMTHLKGQKQNKKIQNNLLIGIGHDRIAFLAKQYIDRGYLTYDEHENLIKYLYDPYIKCGGNGYIKEIIENKVKLLPLKESRD